MKTFFCEFLLFLLLSIILTSSAVEDGCNYSNSYVFCKNVSGKFLNDGDSGGLHIIYVVTSDLRDLRKEDFSSFTYVTSVSIYQGTFQFPKQGNLFSGLNDLGDLRIENSNLTEDAKIAFANNTNLRKLVLTTNKITTVGKDFLSHLKQIEEINLSYNEIHHIAVGAFDELPLLKTLNLTHNKLGLSYDPYYLTLAKSHCLICKPASTNINCTNEDIIKCKGNTNIDQLWWKTHSFDVMLGNNPVCTVISGDHSTVTKHNGTEHLESYKLETCAILENEMCFKHESRKMFLLDVCGEHNYSTGNEELGSLLVKYDSVKDDEKIIFTASFRLYAPFTVMCALLVGIIIGCVVTNKFGKKSEKHEDNMTTQGGISYASVNQHETAVDLDMFQTPMHFAALNGNLQQIRELIVQGEKVSLTNKDGETPLHLAAKMNQKDVVEYLLTQDISVNVRNTAGDTPLIIAARQNHLKIVKHLLKQGGDHEAKDRSGKNPLHYATSHGNNDMIKVLLEKNSNLEITDNEGKTPLCAATVVSHTDTVELLLENNANITASTEDGKTPLHIASWNGNVKIVELLLKYRPDVNTPDKKGYTSLHNASRKGHDEVLKLLLNVEGANVDAQNDDGNTPLHQAAYGGHFKIIQMLLDKGADPNKKNKKKKKPLDVAKDEGHQECINTLSNHTTNRKTTPSRLL